MPAIMMKNPPLGKVAGDKRNGLGLGFGIVSAPAMPRQGGLSSPGYMPTGPSQMVDQRPPQAPLLRALPAAAVPGFGANYTTDAMPNDWTDPRSYAERKEPAAPCVEKAEKRSGARERLNGGRDEARMYRLPYVIVKDYDGTEYMYDRGYCPMFERRNSVVRHTRKSFDWHNPPRTYLYSAEDAPWKRGKVGAQTRMRCEAVLEEWMALLVDE